MLNDEEVREIVLEVRSLVPQIKAADIELAVRSYETRGADGGGNHLGVVGSYVALLVDKARTRRAVRGEA